MTSHSYTDQFSLEGKKAIVTGGAGILGQHFCAGLAESGASIAIVDIEEGRAVELANDLASTYGVECVGIGGDVSEKNSVDSIIERSLSVFGRIDILHNNAASKSKDLDAFFEATEDYSSEQWKEIMNVNVDGMFEMAKAVGKQMIQQGRGGTIVQTSSIYGMLGPDGRIYEGSTYNGRTINTPAVYAASKAAVLGLTRYLATQWACHGIRVNSLTPGGVESGQNETFVANYSSRTPLQRMAKPEEMVGALLYLCSPASSYVTGHNLIVDGGWSAW